MSVAAVLAGERAWWVETAHVLNGLSLLPDGCVQTCTTSPPYWGLRRYGTEPQIWGGDPSCSHSLEETPTPAKTGGTGEASAKQVTNAGSQFGNAWADQGTTRGTTLNEDFNHRWNPNWAPGGKQAEQRPKEVHRGATCTRCGAWLGELGSEPTPALFVAHLVAVFREVRRVLRDDGTVFLNIGDSYASQGGGGERRMVELGRPSDGALSQPHQLCDTKPYRAAGLKPKDLCLIPERLAIALQDDGWYIRSRIAWCKAAPMPESVRDRPTSAWEHIWLLAKNPRYFYDSEAVRQPGEPYSGNAGTFARPDAKYTAPLVPGQRYGTHRSDREDRVAGGANLRNFWLLPPEPFPAAHFATFVPEIPRRCILAGSREGDVVLDPFAGAGTSGLVARRLNRRFIGLELNAEYADMARRRIVDDCPMFESEIA